MHRSMIIVTAALATILAAACDDGGGGSSSVCEVGCQETYLDAYDACAADLRTCSLACTGFSDTACVQACITTFSDTCLPPAGDQLETCSNACPCTAAFNTCNDGCAGDTTCQDACMADYESCTGRDIETAQACVEACYEGITPCAETCQTTYAPDDYEGYIDCTYDCTIAASACHRGCL